ncbi:M14 family metallopeptidase [Polaribacter sp. Hel1_85]|uniref:M14 family metallopeptidase n=1 Tax=Polaribacter sp. Hel1_85 TaxID=1250005 RepID=UPI00052E27B3|nr:M14 family metallopeptidase [Polaribacter sp. Hel1_85]KGL64184.1 zinc carboxypeptidase, M14 family [Polaribacter sp. Hel1_85]
MKKLVVLLFVLVLFSCKNEIKKQIDFTTLFEKSKGTETPEYHDVISFYKDLSESYSGVSLFSFEQTDSGQPLHLVVYSQEEIYNIDEIKNASKNRILINNGIHPGESDGIDASMLLIRDIVQNDSLKEKYKNSIICVIPVYNVGGSLNRNSHTRANQNGPVVYGFRGNARNFDLNRDFIKQDTKNAAAFATIFHTVNPDVFIDNHVSNGADYQYAITHLFTQHNKLGGKLGSFLETEMRPSLEKSLQNKNIDITPYVNVWGTTPEAGFSQFFDSPRYSTGYTTLFNTLGLMVETHMLKTYKIRVEQTYELLFSALDFTEENSSKIKELRKNAVEEVLEKKTYPIAYKIDKENPTELQFKGYEGRYIDSKVTSGKRLFYDTSQPFIKPVKYYNNFVATKSVEIPKAYILQQGWHKIVERLKNNQIEFTRFRNDTIITVEVNHIDEFKTRKMAYEGHYLHYNTSIKKSTQNIQFRKGDVYIDTNQTGIRYLLETLEAVATDSFFNWNFFDTILQQKEGYSSYVFEDVAEKLLAENSVIKLAFEEKLKNDKEFAKNERLQLNFIYKNSPHYEKAHLRLPIFKIF